MILVIGGSGFVGSFLIKSYKAKGIKNIDKKKSPFFDDITSKVDIRNYSQIKIEPEVETVVLLAAEHRDDVRPTSLYYDVNVEGTKNVLKAMDKVGVKNLIFTSSVAIYGLNKDNPDETHFEDPFNDYGKSKWQAEKVIKKWYKSDPAQKSVTIIRPTVIFGERNRGNVYNLLKQISSGKFLMVGHGLNKKSMAYVGNVVSFIINRISLKEKGYNIYNYSDKPDFNMLDLVNLIEKKMDIRISKIKIPFFLGYLGGLLFDFASKISSKKFSVSSVRVKKFCATTQFDSNKAYRVFKPPFSLEQGLNKTLEHEFINPKKDSVLFYSK